MRTKLLILLNLSILFAAAQAPQQFGYGDYTFLHSVNVNSGGSVATHASAAFEIKGTNKGFLPPRLTQTQRDAIVSPATYLTIVNTTTGKYQFYNGTAWVDISTTPTPSDLNATLSAGNDGGGQDINNVGAINANNDINANGGITVQNDIVSTTGGLTVQGDIYTSNQITSLGAISIGDNTNGSVLYINNGSGSRMELSAYGITTNRFLAVPDHDGTIATHDEIPTDNASLTNGAGYLTATAGNALYPQLSSFYADPSWITSLAWSKITGAPSFTTLGSFSATSPLSYNSSTGAFTIQVANTSQSGYLSSTDWNTFNGKVGTSRTISTTSPISGGGDLSANRTLSIAQATTSTDGYLSSSDWNTFNSKLSATITSPSAGNELHYSGSAWINATPGDWRHDTYNDFEEFTYFGSNRCTFDITTSGTGSNYSSVPQGNSASGAWPAPSVGQLLTGTTTTGYAQAMRNVQGTSWSPALSYGVVDVEWWNIGVSALSTPTDRYVVYAGNMNTGASAEPTYGIYFKYSEAESANWQVCTATSNVNRSCVTTSTAVTAGIPYSFRVRITGGATGSLRAYIATGTTTTAAGRITTEITASSGTYPIVSNIAEVDGTNRDPGQIIIRKTAGTNSRSLFLDAYNCTSFLTNPR